MCSSAPIFVHVTFACFSLLFCVCMFFARFRFCMSLSSLFVFACLSFFFVCFGLFFFGSCSYLFVLFCFVFKFAFFCFYLSVCAHLSYCLWLVVCFPDCLGGRARPTALRASLEAAFSCQASGTPGVGRARLGPCYLIEAQPKFYGNMSVQHTLFDPSDPRIQHQNKKVSIHSI